MRRPGANKDLPSSRRLDSFSTINILTISLKPSQRRDTADGNMRPRIRKHNKPPHIKDIGKSITEDAHDSPKINECYPKKHSLPANLGEVQMMTSGAPLLDMVAESRENSPESPEYPLPMRSITTATLVSDSKLGKEPNPLLLVPPGMPSPGALSLPAEFILEDRRTVEDSSRQRKIPQDDSKGSMFMNPDTNTPSPDAVLSKNQKFFATVEQKKKSSTLQTRQPLSQLAGDLVLTNENVCDPRRGSTDVDSSLIQSAIVEAVDSGMMDSRRLSNMRKSSSEGNIHRIVISSDVDPIEPESKHSKPSGVLWRLSSTSVNKDGSLKVGESFSHASSSPSMSPPVVSKEFHLPTHSPPKPQGGWTAESAAVVWQRVLKVLGDVNKIQDPAIHAEAMGCLDNTWQSLVAVS